MAYSPCRHADFLWLAWPELHRLLLLATWPLVCRSHNGRYEGVRQKTVFECCIRDGLCELSNNCRGCLIGGGCFCCIPEPGQCLRLSRAEAPDHREIVHLLGGSECLIGKRNSIRRSVQAQQNAHLHFEGGDGGRSEPVLCCLRGGCLCLAQSFVQCALGEQQFCPDLFCHDI